MAHTGKRRRIGGFFTFLLLLIVVVIGVGFWQGWFVISSQDEEGRGRTDVTLTIDKDEIQRDVDSAVEATRRETREVGKKIEAARDINSVEGVVQSVDTQKGLVTVKTDDGEVKSFPVGDETEISAAREGLGLDDLAAGDNVIVVYQDGERRRVDSITVVEENEGSLP